MKTLRINSILFLKAMLIIILVYSCSSDNNEESDNANNSQTTKVTFNVAGSNAGTFGEVSLDGVYNINYPDNDNQANTSVFAGIFTESTFEGTVKVVNLTYSYYVSEDDYYNITLKLPTGVRSVALGEFQTNSTGMVTEEPTYNMVLGFDSRRAFFNGNIGSNNEILTSLLSKNVVVTISEYEETVNSLGVTTVKRIKGTIGSTANQCFFKTYTGPTSEPADLLCTVVGDFEYNLLTE